jgi:hypothetical protein
MLIRKRQKQHVIDDTPKQTQRQEDDAVSITPLDRVIHSKTLKHPD